MHRVARTIVLKRIAYGEADWIVTFLDREAGRLSGIAKNARASARRFGGALEPGTAVEMRYALRDSEGLVRIDEARVLASALGVMRSLERIGAMARAIHLAIAFLPERQPAPERFDLLESRIALLSTAEPDPADSLRFELEWLKSSGFGPEVAACAACGEEVRVLRAGPRSGSWSFDLDRAGLLCAACGAGAGRRFSVSSAAAAALGAGGGGPIVFPADALQEAGAVLSRYIDDTLGRPLKAWSV